MASKLRTLLVFLLIFVLLHGSTIAKSENEIIRRSRTSPNRNLGSALIDGTGKEAGFERSKSSFQGFGEKKVVNSRVSVSTVAWLTLAMAAATALGAIPFFFVELERQWAGICSGLAAGVMLAASFDLVQEGQIYGNGNWVVIGILSGAIFIWLCKKVFDLLISSIVF